MVFKIQVYSWKASKINEIVMDMCQVAVQTKKVDTPQTLR